MHRNRFVLMGLFVGLLSLAGCNSAVEEERAADGGSTDARPFRSTNSEFDGQPIASMTAQSFVGGSYAEQVRTAVVARGQAVVTALPQPGSGAQGTYITLKAILDKADQINGTTGAAPISTHFQVDAGTESQQYLLAYAPAEAGMTGLGSSAVASHVYVLLDPAVFHPDPSTGEDTYPRDVPATRLSDGSKAKVTLRDDGFSVVGDANGQLLVIEAVPVIEQPNEAYPDQVGFGEPLPAAETQPVENGLTTSFTFLALRQLRIDRSFDGGGISGKNEVQFTAQPTDNYTLEFPRYNTRRFDNAFWTNLSTNPEASTSNTLNPVQWAAYRVLWFRAPDVNYSGVDYNATAGDFYHCDYLVQQPFTCLRVFQSYDFPIAQLTASNTYFRAYMNEDDWVDRLSRRAGDWQGNIRTINFSTGGFQTLYTKLDANNHAWVSSDQVFTQSGIRRANRPTVDARTSNGTSVYSTDSNGLRYKFTRQTITI